MRPRHRPPPDVRPPTYVRWLRISLRMGPLAAHVAKMPCAPPITGWSLTRPAAGAPARRIRRRQIVLALASSGMTSPAPIWRSYTRATAATCSPRCWLSATTAAAYPLCHRRRRPRRPAAGAASFRRTLPPPPPPPGRRALAARAMKCTGASRLRVVCAVNRAPSTPRPGMARPTAATTP